MRIRKRYRVTIDVDINVDNITLEKAKVRTAERTAAILSEGGTPDEGTGLLAAERDLAAQRALQDELMRDPELLDPWLKGLVRMELGRMIDEYRPEPTDEGVFLHPAIERLAPGERHWWRQTLYSGEDDLYDRQEDWWDSVRTEVAGITIGEVDRPGV
jgi:hypothetical protein